MILNPSHKITLSGLPPDVLDAYVRYKKGTRAIVSWIVQYGPARYHGVKSLPLKELASLALSIRESLKTLPDVIHFHFRETIAARKRLSKHFRGFVDETLDNVDTVNHEHFTTSLSQIYADLCQCCGKPNQQCVTTQTNINIQTTAERLKNHYDHLPVGHLSLDDSSELEHPVSCSDCTTVSDESCPTTTAGLGGLTDDELGNAIEFVTLLKQAHETFEDIQQCWTHAARGEVHFVAAAFATNAALASLLQLENQIRELDDTITISEIHRKCCNLTLESNKADEWFHNFIDQLRVVQKEFLHFTDGHHLSTIPSCASCIQKPADYVQSASTSNISDHSNFVKALVDNIIHLIMSNVVPSNIVRNSTPIYAELGYLISHPKDESMSMRTTFGLYMLSRSYRAYLLSSDSKLIGRHRLAALKVAQQVSKSINRILDDKASFPCRCTQTLAYHLQNLSTDMSAYTSQKCWDLYFQSPWIAGNHIIEMLDQVHFYGSHLLTYRHYIGAVVHSYNAVQKLAGMEKIPLLEALCDQFADIYFPGGCRPVSNFRASWTRYIGARLKFKKGHKSRNHRESWCMTIPAHAARSASGLGLPSSHDRKSQQSTNSCRGCDSLLFRIKQQEFHVTEPQWEEISATCHSKESSEEPPLLNLAHYVSASLIGTSSEIASAPSSSHPPKLLLNPFALFHTIVKDIITPISDYTHPSPTEKVTNCICFASTILTGADRITDAKKLGKVEAWRSRSPSKDDDEARTEKQVVLKVMEVLKESMAQVEKGVYSKGTWGAWGLHIGT